MTNLERGTLKVLINLSEEQGELEITNITETSLDLGIRTMGDDEVQVTLELGNLQSLYHVLKCFVEE